MSEKVCYSHAYCDSLPQFTGGLSFLGWAYNEEENIGEYLERAQALLDKTVADYEIIVVNDGSRDRTREIILDYAAKNPKIRLVDNLGNKGVAYACHNAIQHAQKEFLMWQTVDWSYDISKLRGFLDHLEREGADVAAGVRRAPVEATNRAHRILSGILRLFHVRHITRRSDTVWKAFVSITNYLLIRLLFNVPLSDYQNVCIYRSALIQQVAPEANSSFLNPEYLFKACWSGCRIVEIPVDFLPRQRGVAKGTRLKSILASVKDTLWMAWKWRFSGKMKRDAGTIVRLDARNWQEDGGHDKE